MALRNLTLVCLCAVVACVSALPAADHFISKRAVLLDQNFVPIEHIQQPHRTGRRRVLNKRETSPDFSAADVHTPLGIPHSPLGLQSPVFPNIPSRHTEGRDITSPIFPVGPHRNPERRDVPLYSPSVEPRDYKHSKPVHYNHKPGKVGPVYTFVKTDYHGNAKWGVRHRVGAQYGR